MSEQLNITLANSSFYIDPGKTTQGSLRIQIRNEGAEDIACKMVKIKIPYGTEASALTHSNAFAIGNTEFWSEPSSPFPTEEDFIAVSLINDYDTIESSISDSFHLFQIPINPNGEGEEERRVEVMVECFINQQDAEPFKTVSLPFTLQTQKEEDPEPFVNFFSVSSSNVHPDEEVTLEWEIAHGKEMILQPIFLTDHDQVQQRSTTMLSDEDEQPILINSETPIRITRSTGSLKVKLIQSTQFILMADSQGNRGISQLVVYLKKLTVVSFKAKDHQLTDNWNYLEPLKLEWIITYSNKFAPDNQAFLLISEIDNKGNRLPLDGNSPSPPGRMTATRVMPLNPRQAAGSLTVYPSRPTEYTIYISENQASSTKTESLKINMETTHSSPIGSITMLWSDIIPVGWRLCAGGTVTREEIPNTFDELARMLRQTQNNGVLSLPNMRDRFPAGKGSDPGLRAVGGTSGPDSISHTHYIDPPQKRWYTNKSGKHKHFTNPYRTTQPYAAGVHLAVNDILVSPTSKEGEHNHSVDINIPRFNSGSARFSGSSYLNRPKYVTVNFIIRVA